jgi:hypothetical protein
MSTYSNSLRVELIASGDQAGQWGNTTNDNFSFIFDRAIAGYQTVSVVSADQAFTYNDGPVSSGALNEAIYAMIELTTTTVTTAFNVYTNPRSKQYVIWNNTIYSATIYNWATISPLAAAGTGVTIAPGDRVLVVSNGTNFYTIKSAGVTGTVPISNGGTGQTGQQAAINALVGTQTANRVLRSDGTDSTLAQVALATDVTGVLPTANGGTNLSTFTANQVFYASSTSVMAQSSALTFDGSTLGVNSVNVGRGAGAVSSNTAVGAGALNANTTGSSNTAVGQNALTASTVAAANTAIGSNAMRFSQFGGSNTAIGREALYSNILASNNVAVGSSALFFNTSSSNTAVGTSALSNNTTGDNNTAIGASAGSAITTGAKNCIIGSYTGNQGGLDIRTSSNYIVLSDGDGNPRAYWNGANATFNGGLTLTAYLRTAVASVTSASTVTPTSDASNQYNVTALAVPATFAAPSGTPVDGQKLVLRIKDNGTAQALTWNAIYRVVGTVLPTTTVATKTTYVGCIYNSADTVWDVVVVTTQA